MASERLISQEHQVVLHARHAERANATVHTLHLAEAIVVGDVGTIDGAKILRCACIRITRESF
jgi:hypothetical protein